jgi:hypothetical protein
MIKPLGCSVEVMGLEINDGKSAIINNQNDKKQMILGIHGKEGDKIEIIK